MTVVEVVLKYATYSAPPSYNMATYGYQVEADVVNDIVIGETSSDEEDKKAASQGYAPRYLTYGWGAPNQEAKY